MRRLRHFLSAGFYNRFFHFFFSSLFLACIVTSIYLNILVVPDGHIGLLKERTTGFDGSILKPGYHWVWTAFIPLKWKNYLINLTPSMLRVKFHEPLRYTEYLELSNIFRTQVDFKIQFRLSKEKIYQLLRSLDGNINNLDEYVIEKIELILRLKYFEFYKSDTDIPKLEAKMSEYITSEGKINSFSADWEKKFRANGIQLVRLDLLRVYVPDYSLYLAQLQDMNQFLSARRQVILKSMSAESEGYTLKLRNQIDLEKAKGVLELLKKNPLILEYLKYQELNPKTSVVRIESQKSNLSNFSSRSIQNERSSRDNSFGKDSQDEQTPYENSTSMEEVGEIPPIIR